MKRGPDLIGFEPVTAREHFANWIAWRVTAAHGFCLRCMRINPETRDGNQDIMQAPLKWYAPRFVAGWRLGKLYVIRVKRELKRFAKV